MPVHRFDLHARSVISRFKNTVSVVTILSNMVKEGVSDLSTLMWNIFFIYSSTISWPSDMISRRHHIIYLGVLD